MVSLAVSFPSMPSLSLSRPVPSLSLFFRSPDDTSNFPSAVIAARDKSTRPSFAVEATRSLVAGLAGLALLAGAPEMAEAKVILTQPEVKNLVTGKDPSRKASSSSGSSSGPSKKSPPPASMTSDGFDFKPLVLPISLVVVGAGGFALASVDEGFAELMVEGGAKDSRAYAGYETSLKDTPFYGGNGSIPTSASGAKTASSKKTKKGGLFG